MFHSKKCLETTYGQLRVKSGRARIVPSTQKPTTCRCESTLAMISKCTRFLEIQGFTESADKHYLRGQVIEYSPCFP
jgi:hypothetical protein